MQYSNTNTFGSLIGKSKSAITAMFGEGIQFLHWLYLPKLGILISFDKQICCQIDTL